MRKLTHLLLLALLPVVACQKGAIEPDKTASAATDSDLSAVEILARSQEHSQALSYVTLQELSRARGATAAYNDVEYAESQGYQNIHYYEQFMGEHFMKPEWVDDHFDPAEPEILVYQADELTGKMKLVAVEYAFDDGDYDHPPEGFTGTADEWHLFTPTGPWTLHVWVWAHNPNGIFAPYNPVFP